MLLFSSASTLIIALGLGRAPSNVVNNVIPSNVVNNGIKFSYPGAGVLKVALIGEGDGARVTYVPNGANESFLR